MALCPVNMAGEVRFSNSCRVYIFLRVLLHVDKHCHGARLFFYELCRILADFFFQCFVQFHQLLFLANSCYCFTRFQQFLVYHIFLIPPNTQRMNLVLALCRLEILLFFVSYFHNKHIFHCQSQFDAKITFFLIVQVDIQKWFFVFRVVSRLIHVVTNFLLFEPV